MDKKMIYFANCSEFSFQKQKATSLNDTFLKPD
jgi:hypothetical protein